MAAEFATVDEYIDSFPPDVQTILNEVRRTIRAAAPETDEKISYQMPTLTLDGRYVVYFAAWQRHVGLYPVPAVDDGLERELAPYRAAKAAVRFPLHEPIPYDVIARLVTFLVERRAHAAQS